MAAFLLFPAGARADEEPTATPVPGESDVTQNTDTTPDGTAVIEEHLLENEVPNTLTTDDDTDTTNDLMETKSAYTIQTSYTFDNAEIEEVPDPDDADNPIVEANTDNAIQRAIDKALSEVTSNTTQITISVSDGEYNGDIDINVFSTEYGLTPASINAANGLTIVVAAEDAITTDADGVVTGFTTESAGNVKVNGSINITGGDGIDVLLAGLYLSLSSTVNNSQSNLEILGTAKDDTINTTVIGDDATLEIDGGEGADTITASVSSTSTISTADPPAGEDAIQLSGGSGNDTLTVKSTKSCDTRSSNGVTVDGGTGDDTFNLDVSCGSFTQQVTIAGNDGTGDRLNLTGELSETAALPINPASTQALIQLTNDNEKSLAIVVSGVEAYTDALENKTSIAITRIADGKLYCEISGVEQEITTLASFTNYTFSEREVPDLSVSGDTFLSSLVFSYSKADWNSTVEALTINNLYAPGLNLVFDSQKIVFLGAVVGNCITATALDTDTSFGFDIPEKTAHPTDGSNDVSFSLLDVVSIAEIEISAGASLTASGAISLSATTNQTKGMIDIAGATGSLNFVNVKVGSALITINGNLIALSGAISAIAKANVTLSSTNSTLASACIPIAVGVVVVAAEVTLGEGARIEASNGTVTLSSSTNVTITCESTTGKLPVSISAAVAVINSHVSVYGDIVAGGDVTLSALGNLTSTVTAQKGSNASSTSSFGGFFAFSVLIQDVNACVAGPDSGTAGSSSVTSTGGGVSITSESNESSATSATSAAPEAGEGGTGENSTLSSVRTLVTTLLDVVGKSEFVSSMNTVLSDKFTSALSKITEMLKGSDGYAIQTKTTENGTISAPTKAAAGTTVAVSVTPKDGYELSGDTLLIKYLAPGASSFVTFTGTITKDADTGSYKFTMPNGTVTIDAVFATATTTSDDDDGDLGLGDLFNEDDGETLGISELFDEAAGDEQDTWYDDPSDTGAFSVTSDPTMTGGAVLSTDTKADAGTLVSLLVNPGTDKKLTDSTLKVLLGTTEVALTSKGNNEYTFTMPSGNVVIQASFEDVPSDEQTSETTNSGSSSSAQVTGALAVSVVLNTNNAYIDTTRFVTAAGTVSINATGNTKATALADGSPIGEAAASAAAASSDDVTNPSDGTIYPENEITDKNIKIAATINGKVEFVSVNTEDKAAFTVTPCDGYALDATKLTYTYTNSTGTVVSPATLTAGSGGSYYFVMPTDLKEGTNITVSAEFTAVLNNVIVDSIPAGGTATSPVTEAKKGDQITLTITPDAGWKVQSVTPTSGTVAETDGTYVFTMGDSEAHIAVVFEQKGIEVKVVEVLDGNTTNLVGTEGYVEADYIALKDTYCDTGETFTYTPGTKVTVDGKTLTVNAYWYMTGTGGTSVKVGATAFTKTDNGFIVPDEATNPTYFVGVALR